ncbi:MAG: phosphotransferase family protein [Anaerolineae bacterium]
MNLLPSYTACIQRIYPDLAIGSAYLNQQGQYNDVLVVNEALIFRFAKVPAALQTLRQETAILRSIRDHITLQIPDPVYHNLEGSVIGEAFVGYPMIAGKPLWRDLYRTIDDPDVLETIACQLATFLRELHAIPVEETIPIALPVEDGLDTWVDMYARIRDELFSYMRPDARAQVAEHFESYLDDPLAYAFEPVLRHGDFGTGNLIYDPDARRMAGVIDFGGAGLGDPATDMAGLLSSFGEPFLARCAAYYPAIEAASTRIHFYHGTFALQEALFGIENGDRQAFANGMETFV